MTILVGYTNTTEGEAALRHGLSAAESTGMPVTIFPLTENPPAAGSDAALETALTAGAKLLERDPQGRHAAEELLDTSAEIAAHLIIIGVRNRSRVSKIILGSDAQTIILGSQVPVLTVKAASDDD